MSNNGQTTVLLGRSGTAAACYDVGDYGYGYAGTGKRGKSPLFWGS